MSTIESAILAAREVAVTPGAAALRKSSKGQQGTWEPDDETRLRAGWIRVWNEHAKRYDRLDVNANEGAVMGAMRTARAWLFDRVAAAADGMAPPRGEP